MDAADPQAGLPVRKVTTEQFLSASPPDRPLSAQSPRPSQLRCCLPTGPPRPCSVPSTAAQAWGSSWPASLLWVCGQMGGEKMYLMKLPWSPPSAGQDRGTAWIRQSSAFFSSRLPRNSDRSFLSSVFNIFLIFIFNWRITALQYCVGFGHTSF